MTEINYRDNTPNFFSNDYDKNKVDLRVKKRSKAIAEKMYGIDTREAMVEGIEIGATIAQESLELSEGTEVRQTDLENRYNDQIAGNTDIDEVIDARRPLNKEAYQTLGKRLDSMDFKTHNNLQNSISNEVGGGIRSIFNNEITRMRTTLDSRQNKVNIGAITDTHYVIRSNYWGEFPNCKYSLTHYLNLANVSDYLDFAVANGDNCDESTSNKDIILNLQRTMSATFFTGLKCPGAILKGNHDDNSVQSIQAKKVGKDFILTDEDFKQIYQQNGSQGEIRNGNSNYFFYDIPNEKIRVIGLDSYDTLETLGTDELLKYPRIQTSAFSENQIDWLINQALNVDSDTHVIIFTHCSLKGVLYNNPTDKCINHENVLEVIEAFRNGTSGLTTSDVTDYQVHLEYNFEDKGNVIAVIYGHHHKDQFTTIKNVNHITLLNSFGANTNTKDPAFESYWNTPNEDSFTVFSIDKATRTVELLKFGRGEERTFSY